MQDVALNLKKTEYDVKINLFHKSTVEVKS